MCHLRKLLQNLVFEAVLFTTQIKNLHETKRQFQKCFLEIQKIPILPLFDKKVLTLIIFCQFLDISFLYLENLIGRNIRTKFQLK